MKTRRLPGNATTLALCLLRLNVHRDVRHCILGHCLRNCFAEETEQLREQRVEQFRFRRYARDKLWHRVMRQLYNIVEFAPEPEDQEMRLFRVIEAPILSKHIHYTWRYYYPVHRQWPG